MGSLVTWSIVAVVSLVSSQVIADGDGINGRTSNVHPIYSQTGDQEFGHHPGPSDWAGNANPYSRNKKYEQQYYDPSAYHYSQPQEKDYGYSAPSKPGKGKDKGHLLDFFAHFFDKKKELEDEIWDLIFNKGEDYKGHYGEPPSGSHVHHKQKSKEEIFLKIKLLAIASTVLLIVLGGGILLAPLAIGKGRSLSEFLREQNPAGATEIAQLAASVMQAIQHYQRRQT